MVATDDDLGVTNGVNNNNNVFDFDFASSDYITVDKTGAITLTQVRDGQIAQWATRSLDQFQSVNYGALGGGGGGGFTH